MNNKPTTNILLSAVLLIFPSALIAQVDTLREYRHKADSVLIADSIYAWDNPLNQKKHPWKAATEAFCINAGVQLFDRFVINGDYSHISANSVWHNIKNGFVWDNDQFSTNLFAHPYHGGLYFNSARSNGMSFWQSVPYSFCGSLMWELACETDPPAINDLMATTIGGACIGEITHRVSDLVYDDRERGLSRFLREFAGALTCPIRELNRILNGDAWRVRHDYYEYHDYNRIPVDFSVAFGDRYLADKGAMFRGEHNPYLDMYLIYGDAFNDEENKPYDYFTANVTFGFTGNQPLISDIHLLGRLWTAPIYSGDKIDAEFGIFQHFNYYNSQPVKGGTSQVPFRISEAASVGPGVIYRFPEVGNISKLEQHIFLDAILLGGSLTDYYRFVDRDYNMGSGYSIKVKTIMEFRKMGSFSVNADFYRIYTWKGYENKNYESIDPRYLNAQGDKGNATLLVINPQIEFNLTDKLALQLHSSYYFRRTIYNYHENVEYNTFEIRLGLNYKI